MVGEPGAFGHLDPTRHHYYRQFVPDFRGLSVLEPAWGTTVGNEYLTKQGAQVSTVDMSLYAPELTGEQAIPSLSEARLKTNMLPFADTTFDVVLCHNVLEHTSDSLNVLSELHRLLKPGGQLFFNTFNRSWATRFGLIWNLAYLQRRVPTGSYTWKKFMTPEELKRKLEAVGFTGIHMRGINPGLYGSDRKRRRRTDENMRLMFMGRARKNGSQ